ncbi:NAD(P)-binding protein [Macroventuria anomochaeta]|uniref:NAD(P)-binding protein n=1 Tax=Macroventuria anomochaeta TaxID=301207 RepID=A0ACB6RZC4_9PLEO|nr:NAD(P)-binding protein [Macroventuria anomochaeta]KAF2626289.1 NAD(P)-binding protein [Macroventuria anomochaeta]
MTSSIKSIAIVGVTGTIGTYLTHALLAKNHLTITAISRQDSKAEFPPNIQVVRVNYDDHGSITEALKGHDALIITTSIFAPKDTSAKLIKAAAAAGVPWILPNEFGMYNTDEVANETIGTSKKEDRELIESLGVSSWIGISCGFWYEHSLSNGELYGIDINERKATFFDHGTQRLNTSTWPQVGRAVAALLSLPVDTSGEQGAPTTLSTYRNRMVYVSSFTVNQKDMFESVKRVTGTTDSDWNITSEPAKQRYENARERLRNGDRVAFGRVLYTRYFYEDAGLFEKTHGLDTENLGLPKEDLDQSTKKAVSLVENGYWAKYGQ